MAERDQQTHQDKGRHRSAARLAAVQALYEIAITGAAASSVLEEFFSQRWLGADEEQQTPLAKPDVRFMSELVRGVSAQQHDLETLVCGALSEKASFDRLEVLLRLILKAGAFELLKRPDIPLRVVINEYLNVAHAFFSESEAALVNGVLDQLAQKLRPQEIAMKGDA